MTNYSDLTPLQKIQVAFLFADELFNRQACDFTYYIDAHGDVKGRTALMAPSAKLPRCKSNDCTIVMNVHASVTAEQGQRATAASESLARVIAQTIYSEVLHENVNH